MPLTRTLGKRALLLLFVIFVLFLVVEGFFRVAHPQITANRAMLSSPMIFQSSSYLPWQLYSSASDFHASPHGEYNVSVRVNSYGLRDDERPLVPKGKKRILFVGDSFTFGHGVEEEDRYTEILEQHLQTRGFDYDIFNAGYASGYSPDTYSLYVQREGLDISPDVVVVGFYVGNDVLDLYKNEFRGEAEERRIISNFYFVDDDHRLRRSRYGLENFFVLFLTRYSHAFVYVRDRLELMLNPIPPETMMYHVTSLPSLEKQWIRVLQSLSDLQDVLEQREIPLVIVIIPSHFQLSDARWSAYEQGASDEIDRTKPQQVLLDFCNERNISCVDLYPALKGRPSLDDLYYSRDGHWNAAGHRFVAEVLSENLRKLL